MPPKPVDKRRPDETRYAIWMAVRQLGKAGCFSVHDVWELTRCSKEVIREYLTGLFKAGHIEARRDTRPCSPFLYVLIRDNGLEAPRVRPDGTLITQGLAREQMWRTLKISNADFSPKDLAIIASTDTCTVYEIDAKNYLHFLKHAGYVVEVSPARPGHRTGAGIQARYRLLPSRYTGPKPPQVQRVRQVYDPNLGKVVWKGGADDSQ